MKNIPEEFNEKIAIISLNLIGDNGLNFEYLTDKRNRLLSDWRNFGESYLKLTPIEKIMHLGPDLFIFSMFRDSEVLDLMNKLNISFEVSKHFVDLVSLFESLQKFIMDSKFNWNIKIIMMFYYTYSFSFVSNSLYQDLGIEGNDSKAFFRGLSRREEKNKLYKDEQNILELIKFEKKELKKIQSTYFPNLKNGFGSMLRKTMRFPHKHNFSNIYLLHYEFNQNLMTTKRVVSDFKCDFFQLADFLIRDKEVLWGKEEDDLELTYGEPGNRRFKIKRVEQLFVNLSDNYSK
ncbi:hypothetical protein [uncultured Psychroserpens sp.]|uniref:hypothetical protein n=1 Tax=uncultured Psychroserpens sp. TaxID=255436 RepID=UPI00260BF5EE|nr:hypothetical protein [uncultured Psychroserpens sp.]